MTTITNETIAEIKAGLKGVTPGPWVAASKPSSVVGWPIVAQSGRSIAGMKYLQRDDIEGSVYRETAANAAHIARLDPDTVAALIERLERAEADKAFTLTDPARLIRAPDVEGICTDPDMCFEYGPVRCEPCARKASEAKGAPCDYRRSRLPEVCRLKREVEALRSLLRAISAGDLAPAPDDTAPLETEILAIKAVARAALEDE